MNAQCTWNVAQECEQNDVLKLINLLPISSLENEEDWEQLNKYKQLFVPPESSSSCELEIDLGTLYLISEITIFSYSRLCEFYVKDGEYVGSFRAQKFIPSKNVPSDITDPSLEKNVLDFNAEPQNTRTIKIKFFFSLRNKKIFTLYRISIRCKELQQSSNLVQQPKGDLDLSMVMQLMGSLKPSLTDSGIPNLPSSGLQSILMQMMMNSSSTTPSLFPNPNDSVQDSKVESKEIKSEPTELGILLTEDRIQQMIDKAAQQLEQRLQKRIDDGLATIRKYVDDRLSESIHNN